MQAIGMKAGIKTGMKIGLLARRSGMPPNTSLGNKRVGKYG